MPAQTCAVELLSSAMYNFPSADAKITALKLRRYPYKPPSCNLHATV
jgi:hypothetical protein